MRMFRLQVECQQLRDAERANFRARECEVTKRKPFQPVLEHNRTVPDDVVLHSTIRASERRRFDEYLEEKKRLKLQFEEVESDEAGFLSVNCFDDYY